jgi:ubiquinone biosynthesis protein UbiJ
MSETQQNQNRPHLLLTMAMIVLETIFTFILKHDRVVGLQAKKFIDQNITIKINSYLPYFDIYVQFTEQGILFDSKAPEQAVNLDIRTTLLDLVSVFVFANRRSIKKMRIDGDLTLKDEFRDLALFFSLPKVLSDWKQWLSEPSEEQDIVSSKKRIAPLLEKIEQQRSSINTLQTEVKQYKNRIRRLEQKQKKVNIGFSLICGILIVLLVYNFWLG